MKNDDPTNSLNLLIKRVNKGKAFDDEIAGFLGERVLIEEKYYKDLLRLTKKQIAVDDNFMGGFGCVYKEYINISSALAEIHKKLTDVLAAAEVKMRARLTIQDLAKIKTNETSFRKQIKALNEKNSKIRKYEDKLKKKSSSHYEKKLSDATQSYQQLRGQYDCEVNPFFDDIEKSDEFRMTNMKDIFQYLNHSEKEIYNQYNNLTDVFESRIQDLDIDLEIEHYCSELLQISQNRNFVSDTASYQTTNSSLNLEVREKDSIKGGSIAASIRSRSSSFHKPASPVSSSFENTIAPPPEVDEEGYSIPPPVPQPWAITEEPDETNSINDNDEDNDGFGQLENETINRKLKIEIKNEVIKDENVDNDAKEAISKIATRVPSLLIENNNPRSSVARRRRTIASTSSSTTTDDDRFRYSIFSAVDSPVFDWRKGSFSKPVVDPSLLAKKSGMKITVKEKMNTLIVKDVISKLAIFGDIYVAFSTIPQELLQGQHYFKIKISNYELIKQAVPNPNYIVKQEDDKENEFTCNLTALLSFASQNINTSVAILKYQINVDNDQKSKYLPLYVNPIWKSEPNNLSLLLAYQLNTTQYKAISVSELRFFVSLYGDIRGIQLKPHGIWNNDKKRLIWKDDNILKYTSSSSLKEVSNENVNEDESKEITSSSESLKVSEPIGTRKLMARFETGEQCPFGNINIQFSCNSLISAVEISVENDEVFSNLMDLENINYNTAIKYIITNNNNK